MNVKSKGTIIGAIIGLISYLAFVPCKHLSILCGNFFGIINIPNQLVKDNLSQLRFLNFFIQNHPIYRELFTALVTVIIFLIIGLIIGLIIEKTYHKK